MCSADQGNAQSSQQNVQRLGSLPLLTLPLVLSNLNYDPAILAERERLIQDGKTKGNNEEVNAYKDMLPDTLPPAVFQWCVGLLLSDASLQLNISKKKPCARIKMQQSVDHIEFVEATVELLKPWIFGIQRKNDKMVEITTVQHKAFLPLIDVFHDGQTEIEAAACVLKKPQPCIKEHLTPICVAAWYMGDGNRAGRACNFHTEGFFKEGTELLAQLLTEVYGWETRLIDKGYSERMGHSLHILQVRTVSSDSVRETLTPYMVDCFLHKIPTLRKRRPKGYRDMPGYEEELPSSADIPPSAEDITPSSEDIIPSSTKDSSSYGDSTSFGE